MVSIIVPVYNAEKYIEECLYSLIRQTYHDIEIILIDDGSRDHSSEICEKYSLQDSRINLIQQQNAGVSAARNTGIDRARGEYIMFCDSDDVVHPQWVEQHLRAQKENHDSLIVSNVARFFNDSVPENENVKYFLSVTDYYSLFIDGLSGYPINKIFIKDIILRYEIRFNKNLPIGEDVTFVSEYLHHCKNCLKLDNTLYYYRQVETSAVHRYHPRLLEYMLNAFYVRVPFISDNHIAEYCDHWLCEFIKLLGNVHDERNLGMSWIDQMAFNQKCLISSAMRFCLEKSTGNTEHPLVLTILKSRVYAFYYLLQKLR